ncbi:hypothetical protein Dimus_008918 [Dionaea muscipula]
MISHLKHYLSIYLSIYSILGSFITICPIKRTCDPANLIHRSFNLPTNPKAILSPRDIYTINKPYPHIAIKLAMASSKMITASLAFFLVLNLFFLALVTACEPACPSLPKPKHHKPKPKPTPTPSAPSTGVTCPIDALKLGVCANVLNGLLNIVLGTPPKEPCCTLLQGLADVEAAVCLCTAIKANILGINLDIPISLSLLLNDCGNNVPKGFQCAA